MRSFREVGFGFPLRFLFHSFHSIQSFIHSDLLQLLYAFAASAVVVRKVKKHTKKIRDSRHEFLSTCAIDCAR